MSYKMWCSYGYGICVDDIREHNVSRLEELLELAPELQGRMRNWLLEKGTAYPDWDDYMEYDTDYDLGLAVILKEAILEIEGIELTACDNFGCEKYLIYQPSYPWNLSEQERNLTEKDVRELLLRNVGILTGEPVAVAHQAVQNGG